MKDFSLPEYFVICFLISALIYAPSLAKSNLYISQQAIVKPSLISTSPPVSLNNITTTNSSFITYQNNVTLGMMIKYPFNWKTIQADGKALIFLPPSKRDNFSESLALALFNINSSISAGNLFGEAINNYGEHYNDFFIIYSKPIAFQGDPAYILLYTYTNPEAGKIVAMDIGIKNGNKAYVISYSAQQSEYNTYAPTIEKMIDSFRMI